jgi:hypothetical protein
MRPVALLLGAALALASGRAEAAFLTGEQLLQLCHSSTAQDHAICSAYIVGVADALVSVEGASTLPRRACFAPTVTSNALIASVMAHAAQRPQDARGTGSDLVYTALVTFYPC